MSNNTLPAWSIKQLQEALLKDLEQCRTVTEKTCCKAIGGKHIRETAYEWAKQRKLTSLEVAIAEQYGYRHDA